ncbi:MAG: hypothetical protein ACI81L_000985 [Verrucomicrobiales bacterium]
MWIDRIITTSPEGPHTTELHPRLTVISSIDDVRRREAYERVLGALQAKPGSTMEVRTELGDFITATRSAEGGAALFDTNNNLAVRSDDRGLGIIGQLNSGQDMANHLKLFHVTTAAMRQRARDDADFINVAGTPLDQLFELAQQITTDEQAVLHVDDRRSSLSDSIRQRESREATLSQQLEVHTEERKKIAVYTYGAVGGVFLGVVAALMLNLATGLVFCVLASVVAAIGRAQTKNAAADDGEIMGRTLEIQLGRVNEMFDSFDLGQNRRTAEQSLTDSRKVWHNLAGALEPSILLKDRPRLEELASHLQLIANERVEVKGDTSLLVGFASLLADLNRRFPAERVPLLVDDLFAELDPQYHGVLRELLLRASHRRQVVLESADVIVTRWAAVEAVGGDGLLITDHEIDVEPIIQQAVATGSSTTV